MKPIILISGEDGFDHRSGSPHFLLSRNYPKAVTQAGGMPVLGTSYKAIEEYVELADGLLLTHGPIIHPARYGQIAAVHDEIRGFVDTRDDLDFALCYEFLKEGKPVMAIGRGARVMNITIDKYFADKRGSLKCLGISFAKNMFDNIIPEFNVFVDMCKEAGK